MKMKTWQLANRIKSLQPRLVLLMITFILMGAVSTKAQVKSIEKKYNMRSFTDKGAAAPGSISQEQFG